VTYRIPSEVIFEKVRFPKFKTFDNTATPEGDETALDIKSAPVDQDELREIIGDAVAEAEANDPKVLKAEIVKLKADLAKKPPAETVERVVTENDPAELAEAEARGLRLGLAEGQHQGFVEATKHFNEALSHVKEAESSADDMIGKLHDVVKTIKSQSGSPTPLRSRRDSPVHAAPSRPLAVQRAPSPAASNGDGTLSGSDLQLLGALSWWAAMGFDAPTRVQAASIAGWRVTSGHLRNIAGSLKTRGLIAYPRDGTMALTDDGAAVAPPADTSINLHDRVRSVLDGSQRQAFEALLSARGHELTREALADKCGWSPTSGHLRNVLGSMRSMEIIDYPTAGSVALAEWVIERRSAAA
jgi:hypothetical protein